QVLKTNPSAARIHRHALEALFYRLNGEIRLKNKSGSVFTELKVLEISVPPGSSSGFRDTRYFEAFIYGCRSTLARVAVDGVVFRYPQLSVEIYLHAMGIIEEI